jgi:phosphomannomutase
MTLIASISGIRGTIGGAPNDGLSPMAVVRYTSAYGTWLLNQNKGKVVVVGRDARLSGDMVNRLVTATLMSLGIDVIDLGLSTTPTVEMMVPHLQAAGGLILTASHNPAEWNALKMLDHRGHFLSGNEGEEVMHLAEKGHFTYAEVGQIGQCRRYDHAIAEHIRMILELPLVDVQAIRSRNFRVAVDAVNSTGGTAVPDLLRALGVEHIYTVHCDPNGRFPHNPEPLPEHLGDIARLVQESRSDLGIVVDPDVDRLALVSEDGRFFGEEYTLVAVADYVLMHENGHAVSNLSSTRALRDVAERHGRQYYASAVGEVNVVEKMAAVGAVIGGEGNGGVIYPNLHAGRDALLGIALLLSHLARRGGTMSELRASYPAYYMSKNKMVLPEHADPNRLFDQLAERFAHEKLNRADGLRIDFEQAREWVHFRRSNTEPIVRIYAESPQTGRADALALDMIKNIENLLA